MPDQLAARAQMGTSLAFHIVFAALGVGLPLLFCITEGLALWRKDATLMMLTRRWVKASAVLFAIGAVSGTILSFELGLLWPTYTEYAGSVIGLPFALEGFAFFLEAIQRQGNWYLEVIAALAPPMSSAGKQSRLYCSSAAHRVHQ